jgi:hypothetical protein
MTNLLPFADVRINGSRPCDIQVHDKRFFFRVLAVGALGFGEAYMDGRWECQALASATDKANLAKFAIRRLTFTAMPSNHPLVP